MSTHGYLPFPWGGAEKSADFLFFSLISVQNGQSKTTSSEMSSLAFQDPLILLHPLNHENCNQQKKIIYIKINKVISTTIKTYHKGPVHQKDIAFLNVHAPNHRVTKYMRQNLLEPKGGTEKSTVTVGEVNTHLSKTGKRTR